MAINDKVNFSCWYQLDCQRILAFGHPHLAPFSKYYLFKKEQFSALFGAQNLNSYFESQGSHLNNF